MSPPTSTGHDIDALYSMVQDILSREEFHKEIRRVQKEFADLIDETAAGYVVVAEKGRLEKIKPDTVELADGGHVTVEGQITRLDRLRTFTRKDGSSGRVISLYILPEVEDGEGRGKASEDVRISFWENRDIERVQAGEFREGDRITVINGRVKINNYGTTVNVGKYTEVKSIS